VYSPSGGNVFPRLLVRLLVPERGLGTTAKPTASSGATIRTCLSFGSIRSGSHTGDHPPQRYDRDPAKQRDNRREARQSSTVQDNDIPAFPGIMFILFQSSGVFPEHDAGQRDTADHKTDCQEKKFPVASLGNKHPQQSEKNSTKRVLEPAD